MIDVSPSAYSGLQLYYGDIHNHCGISYGHGSLEDAYTNARLQLDFAAVTGHAFWPDMPRDIPRLASMVDFHDAGFARLESLWTRILEITEQHNQEGTFVTFPAFEWHSARYGDHCIYFNGPNGRIVRAPDIEAMREELRCISRLGTDALLVPHHVGYPSGHRGIAWDAFSSEFTPVVEIVSMHGCSEFDDAPRPYLHTMGPRDSRNSVREGLRRGHRFGFIGSTDHHSAHPGSHGHGRMAAWAKRLTRDSLWEAIKARRVYALTGDRIRLAVELNGTPMGGVYPAIDEREIALSVVGGGPIDYLELVRNGAPIYRLGAHEILAPQGSDFVGRVALAVGWGRRNEVVHWHIEIGIVGGRLVEIEPRFRGAEVVAPLAEEQESYQFSRWKQLSPNRIYFHTHTQGNPTTSTDSTQGFALRIEGNDNTRVVASINGREICYTLGELRSGSKTGHLEGLVSGAFRFERAVHEAEYAWTARVLDRRKSTDSDYYYIRVRQLNDQWAWSSPIWVGE